MQVKSFFANTVEAAMLHARRELGEEAMLVNTRKTTPESKHLGQYEVIFASEEITKQHANNVREMIDNRRDAPRPAADSAPQASAGELADIRRQLAGIRNAISRSDGPVSGWMHAVPELAEIQALLEAHEVDAELAHSIVSSVARAFPRDLAARRAPALDRDRLHRALIEEMESRIKVAPSAGVDRKGPRTVALVGPPGRGKTTTLVKLALTCGLAARLPVKLISMDTHRIAAAEQLRSYAAILGVPFQVAETPNALAHSLAESRNTGLTLIDTPGYSPHDIDCGAELARFLAARADIDRHLVLRIDMKSADLQRAVDRFAIFEPAKLIFTGLDEAEAFGSVFSEAARCGKPVSFLGWGQQIPEDLEPASLRRLIELTLNGGARAAKAAAA